LFDLIVRNARLPDDTALMDIAVQNGKIITIGRAMSGETATEIDAEGHLVTPPFVDSHCHMDAALTYGQPRVNSSGTLLEGIELWGQLKPTLTIDEIKKRVLRLCRWSIARGTLVVRSHVDISDDQLLAVQALIDVREEMKPWLDLQLVAFPQDGFLRAPSARQNLLRALDMGVDVIGGIPHFEPTIADGGDSVRQLCEIAVERGLMVDMHCDESDDPMSRHIETLTSETQRLGLNGRVTGSHLTSMHSMDNDYVSGLIPLMAEADIHVIANPLINITLQGRQDTYPKRRGMTRVKELIEAGVNVAMGHDNMMDPFYSLGSHDMLDVAHMGLHVAQMTSVREMNAVFEAVTTNAARVLNLDGYGLEVGCHADMVILNCRDPIEALRLRPQRLFVIRRGKIISRTTRSEPVVSLGSKDEVVSFFM
jgi:cytosine deaminase